MAGEEAIELSVQETNDLRAKLGLAPLRGVGDDRSSANNELPKHKQSNDEMLEMSVDATNELRHSLGLAPLRVSSTSTTKEPVHKPAENVGEAKGIQDRLDKARLEREVQKGISSTFGDSTLADEEDDSALSWAQKMRSNQSLKKEASAKKPKAKKATMDDKYSAEDLQGMKVAHNVSDLAAGSTTIMTLADTPLLKTQNEASKRLVGLNDEEHELENVELTNQQKQRDGLRKKRQVELGMGRAGGYAGFDDDEFEELGGTLGTSRVGRGTGSLGAQDGKVRPYGFQIGATVQEETERGNDLFAGQEGPGISLEPAQADVTASDFMTVEEDLEQSGKKRKTDTKFKKKKKKEKKNRRKRETEEDEEENTPSTREGLLDELEATAVETTGSLGRKRRRFHDDEDAAEAASESEAGDSKMDVDIPDEEKETAKKRARFDEIMAKGNARTAEAFKVVPPAPKVDIDDEPDDAFLNAALAKARRLRRLKEMSYQGHPSRGADAVAQALQKSREQSQPEEPTEGGVTFAIDDTREFTRALRARAEQAERQQARKAEAKAKKIGSKTNTLPNAEAEANVETVDESMAEANEEENIMDLAKEIKDDGKALEVDLDGTTATTTSVGRGMSNVLSMLRRTGEISGKNAGKEEMRGRAKDKRTYEDYEELDLSKVVRIGHNATEKDKEFAKREIKLEYRDDHGRLLTRKEAYRNLCYQFHGHGSSAKNEERRLRQIAMEQSEARLASRQVGDDTPAAGSLGALKATQRATGKAFVVHKT